RIVRLPVNPEVERVLPSRQLADARPVPAADLHRELIGVRGKRVVVDDLRALRAVDPKLLPHLAALVGAERAREVATPHDGVARGDDPGHRRGVLAAALDLVGGEAAIAVPALRL